MYRGCRSRHARDGQSGKRVPGITRAARETAMSAAMTSGVARAAGADLCFERRGSGPPLLMIPGGGGDGGAFSAIARILAETYTVLTYDRRGKSRSPLHSGQVKIKIAEQSADAVEVLHACGFCSARVFGNSGGATIALDLAAHHPQAVQAVVAHEPPVPRVLPDPDDYLAIFDEIDRVREADGWQAAFTVFQVKVGRIAPGTERYVMSTLLEPEQVLPPGQLLDLLKRLSGNWEYMTRCEVRSFIDYVPDLDQIVRNGVRIAPAAGVDSDPFDRRVSAAIADRLGVELADFPGGHLAPMNRPAEFATGLFSLLQRL